MALRQYILTKLKIMIPIRRRPPNLLFQPHSIYFKNIFGGILASGNNSTRSLSSNETVLYNKKSEIRNAAKIEIDLERKEFSTFNNPFSTLSAAFNNPFSTSSATIEKALQEERKTLLKELKESIDAGFISADLQASVIKYFTAQSFKADYDLFYAFIEVGFQLKENDFVYQLFTIYTTRLLKTPVLIAPPNLNVS